MPADALPIRQALLSVSDKRGLVPLARELHGRGVALTATGGTARALRQAELPARDISELTGFPELMDGRLKTLHPLVHGGLLALRDNPAHRRDMDGHGIEPIDLLAVNLYPFEATRARTSDAAVLTENIDIGGPAMIRAAAKNHAHVCALTSPDDYAPFLDELRIRDGATGLALRRRLAARAFRRIAAYDAAVAAWMAEEAGEDPSDSSDPARAARRGMTADGDGIPAVRPPGALRLARELRYGENPHQRAALYLDAAAGAGVGAATARQLQGKPLGYNNLLDADAALALVAEFDPGREAAVAVVKHAIPCGAALRDSAAGACAAALACDPVSAFGGVIACNRAVDAETAAAIAGQFTELVIAPQFEPGAAGLLERKPSLRLLATGGLPDAAAPGRVLRSIAGGLLVQEGDARGWDEAGLRQVSRRRPGRRELADLRFAFLLCKHVRSNAVVMARDGAAVGIGGGQVSRVDAVAQAARKAADKPDGARESVLASDGFFPFADGVLRAAEAGVRAIVQPGGSKRDQEAIDAADAHDIAMLFTGARQFRH